MTWAEYHTRSETLAGQAEAALRRGDKEQALAFYSEAAEAESRALDFLDDSKQRTIGISAVSASALWYKSGQYAKAQQVAYQWLSKGTLPAFAEEQLQGLLQAIWNETVRQKAGFQFVPGQVIVSVKGGEVIAGGAPLDLIVEKVQTIQSLYFRTAEYLDGMPHRKHGGPSAEIRGICRPWLFQTVPGSYQFAVAVQEPAQQTMFPSGKPKAREVASRFLEILKASVEDPDDSLREIVPDVAYRNTFLKLARNLAPTGKSFQAMEIRSAEDSEPITLDPGSRKSIRESIKRQMPQKQETSDLKTETLTGTLRAVHLDEDWLEVTVEDKHIRVEHVGETIDDIIGPMVNRPVIVQSVTDSKGQHFFRDIEPAE